MIAISLLGACAGKPLYREVIQHPGEYELVYYGYQTDTPQIYKATVNGKVFLAEKDTVVPSVQSVFLLQNTHINEGESVLDIGTGSGVQAIFAAEKASKVVATDINSNAIESTQLNIKLHNLGNLIETRLGDLFQPVRDDEIFDVIIFNIDYPSNRSEQGLWEVHERFFAQAKKHLKSGGRIYYQAGWLHNIPDLVRMIEGNGFKIMRMNMETIESHHRQPIAFEIVEKKVLR